MSPKKTPASKPDAVRGLTDGELTSLIEVMSKFLREYVAEWDRRLEERKADAS